MCVLVKVVLYLLYKKNVGLYVFISHITLGWFKDYGQFTQLAEKYVINNYLKNQNSLPCMARYTYNVTSITSNGIMKKEKMVKSFAYLSYNLGLSKSYGRFTLLT